MQDKPTRSYPTSFRKPDQRWRTARTVLQKRCTCEVIVPTISGREVCFSKNRETKQSAKRGLREGLILGSASFHIRLCIFFQPIFSPTNYDVRCTSEGSRYKLNCVPTPPSKKFICWSPDPQDLRMWLYLVIKIFTDVIKVKWGQTGALVQHDWCSYERGRSWYGTTQRTEQRRHGEKTALFKPRREASGWNQPYQHHNLRLLSSGTIRKWISVVYASQSLVLWYGSPSKLMFLSLQRDQIQ